MGSSGDRLCQTSPIPRSPDGDNKKRSNIKWANMKKGKYKYQRGSGVAAWAGVNGLVALGSGWTIQ